MATSQTALASACLATGAGVNLSVNGLQTCPLEGTSYTHAAAVVLRVLVVDDDHDQADSLALLLRLWGHDVRVAYHAAAALELAPAFRPDVVLLDLAMPKMNGCQLALELRLQHECAKALLVAITGYADEAHRHLCERAGCDHFLAKPAAPAGVEKLLLDHGKRLAEMVAEVGVRGLQHLPSPPCGLPPSLAADDREGLGLYERQRGTLATVLRAGPPPRGAPAFFSTPLHIQEVAHTLRRLRAAPVVVATLLGPPARQLASQGDAAKETRLLGQT